MLLKSYTESLRENPDKIRTFCKIRYNLIFGIISKERTEGGLNKRAIFAPLFCTLSVFPN